MKRSIIYKLRLWKENKSRKPLVMTGLRQCGKTYTLKQFGADFFEDTAYFNFEENPSLCSIFDQDFNIERILDELGNIFRQKEIVCGKTLVIFDEIQSCPKAITSLKYFCENKRELHVIAAGSLLGVALKNKDISFPVGKVDRLQMFPMSFKEFLWAEGFESLCNGTEKYADENPLSALYTSTFEKELRYYFAVGGMPEAVLSWSKNHNISEVVQIQNTILQDYESDFSKHAPITDVAKIGWIWDSIPAQLAKDNKKFIFSHVKAGKRSADLEDALMWLVGAGLVYKLNLVTNPQSPISAYADNSYFKVYFADTGLLRAKAKIAPELLLESNESSLGNSGVGTFKGAFVENYCLSELIKNDIEPYFWTSGNTAELDFLFEYSGEIYPMEAKAESNTRAKSYNLFCTRYKSKKGFRISMKNIGVNMIENTKSISLPLYLLWLIKKYL